MQAIIKKFPVKKSILIAIIIIFLLSLIPIYLISFYNHPCVDDYSFGAMPFHAYKDSGSPFIAVEAAFNQVFKTYEDWQGTYSAIFLMGLQPGIWGEDFYFLSTFIVLTSFIVFTLYFTYNLFVRYFNADKKTWLIISLVVLGISINFVPSPVEAFFWYNGSIYYTFFYALSLLLFGLIIGYILTEKKNSTLRYSFLVLPLSFIIGGANYVTALFSIIIIFIFALYAHIKKLKKRALLTASLFILAAGLIISASAPGNAVRQARLETGMAPLNAVISSFTNGTDYIIKQTSKLPVLMGLLFTFPFIFGIIKNNKKFMFRYPLLVFVLSFCVFCSQFTPTLYAIGFNGPKRVENIRFYIYLWFIIFNFCYFTGWLYGKVKMIHNKKAITNTFNSAASKVCTKYAWRVFIVLSVLFVLSIFTVNYRALTSISALISLNNGEAAQYDREIEQRLTIINSNDSEITLTPLSVKPYVLYFDDLGDPPDWRNSDMARYFGKESIVLKAGS